MNHNIPNGHAIIYRTRTKSNINDRIALVLSKCTSFLSIKHELKIYV